MVIRQIQTYTIGLVHTPTTHRAVRTFARRASQAGVCSTCPKSSIMMTSHGYTSAKYQQQNVLQDAMWVACVLGHHDFQHGTIAKRRDLGSNSVFFSQYERSHGSRDTRHLRDEFEVRKSSYRGVVAFTTTVDLLGTVPSVGAGVGAFLTLRQIENVMPCVHERDDNRCMLSGQSTSHCQCACINLPQIERPMMRTMISRNWVPHSRW